VEIIPLCCYPNDMTLVSAKSGYDSAMKHYPNRFNENNLALVPFAIRTEAFDIPSDKAKNRRALGLDENKFTVVLFDGGYGIGKMGKVTELLAKSDMNITVVPVCGKNKKLYEKLKAIQPSPTVDLKVYGYTDKILQLLASADLFMGKSGASSVAEPCFFGVPEIITSYATQMEQHNAHYYIDYVGNAIAVFNPKKAAEKVRFFYDNPSELEKLAEKARARHGDFGAEKTADVMWEMLKKKFPELNDVETE
ncbi:MAG: glycosyltransferase, partial [Candidatus Neoclostridium sp.]